MEIMGYNKANEMCDKRNASVFWKRCGRVSPLVENRQKVFYIFKKPRQKSRSFFARLNIFQILIYRDVHTDFVRLFCVAFSKATARAALAQKTAFSFCKAFSFVPLASKEKASLEYWYQKLWAAFLWLNSRKEKLTKETANTGLRAPYLRHYSWRPTFEKVDETTAWFVRT